MPKILQIFIAVILLAAVFSVVGRFYTSSTSDQTPKSFTLAQEDPPRDTRKLPPPTPIGNANEGIRDTSIVTIVSHVQIDEVPTPVSAWIEDVFRYGRPNAVVNEIVTFDGSMLTQDTEAVQLALDENTTIAATRRSGTLLATGGIKWIGRIDADGGTVNIETTEFGEAVIRITPLGQRRFIRPTPYAPYYVLYTKQSDHEITKRNDDI